MPETSPRFTVAICTNGRNLPNLEETLAALRAQSLAPTNWDLLIVDNASNPPIANRVDLGWHPSARVVVELCRGIGRARLRAMREFLASSQHLLLFLDDDNLAARNLFETGLQIAVQQPGLGCWGGQLLPRYGAPPPPWIGPFLKNIAVFPVEEELRSAVFTGNYDAVPPTAGLWLRRAVAEHYLKLVEIEPLRCLLGGTADVRIGAEDMDIALGALDLGLSIARIPRLVVTHIIPSERLTEEYMANVIRGIRAGTLMLEAIRYGRNPVRGWWPRFFDRLRAFRLPSPQRRFFNAELDGESIALRLLRDRRPLDSTAAIRPLPTAAAKPADRST